jgi:hypothetical protein
MEPKPNYGGKQTLRDLGPPTESERTIIARILIRHGYPPPLPPALRFGPPPRLRPW